MVEENLDDTFDETVGTVTEETRPLPPPPPSPPPPGSGGPYGYLPPPPPGGLVPRRPPRRSSAWIVAGSALSVVLLAFTAFQFVDVMAHGEHDVTWVVDEPVSSVVVTKVGGGGVHVVGAPVDRVTVQGHIGEGLRATAFDHRLVGDRLEVTASCPNFGGTWCSVDYLIEVPYETDVRIRTDAGVRVENISGEVEVRADAAIEVSGLSGLVLMSTGDGSVRATGMRSEVIEAESGNGSVSISTYVAPRSIIAKSGNGSVEVLVPRTGDSYSVDIDSNLGSQDVEVVVDPASDRRLTARTSNGSARIGYSGS